MKTIFLILFFLPSIWLFSQKKSDHIFLFTSKSDSFKYSKTDFNKIDTLDKWCYTFTESLYRNIKDSIPPVGNVYFSRITPLLDTTGYKKYKKEFESLNSDGIDKLILDTFLSEILYFKPHVYFKVFLLKDSNYAMSQSKLYKRITSNVPPYAGGDIFKVGDYFFVNTSFSVKCCPVFNATDFCRPLINFIFKDLIFKRNENIQSLLKQLPIKRCK